MLAPVIAELLPQALTPTTWRSALAGFAGGAVLMLALDSVLAL